jgi:hypothetical protein
MDDVNGTPAAAAAPSTAVQAPPASDLAARVAEALKPDFEGKLATALAEIESLKAARAEQDEALQNSKFETGVAEACRPITGLHHGKDDLEISKAVSTIGNAKFHQKTLEQKLSMIGADPALAKTPTTELERYFGPRSKSSDAMSLARQSPARYSALRKVAKLKGIL